MLTKIWVVVSQPLKSSFALFLFVSLALVTAGVWLTIESWGWLHPTPPPTANLGEPPGSSSLPSASNSETLRNVGLLLAGAIAFVLACWRGWVAERQSVTAQQQAETAQQGLLYDRYQRGVQMLGDRNLAVRLGGIYALRRLSEDEPERYHVEVMRLFCAFVRNPPDNDYEGSTSENADNPPHPRVSLREDVQAVLDAVGSRRSRQKKQEGEQRFHLDFHEADLRGGRFSGMNLSSSKWLTFSGLSKPELFGHAQATNLSGAKLCGAHLDFSELANADLEGACLCNAWLLSTDLSESNLAGAKFHGAIMIGAEISGAKFSTSNGTNPALGLIQDVLDCCRIKDGSPPHLLNVRDAVDKSELAWGK